MEQNFSYSSWLSILLKYSQKKQHNQLSNNISNKRKSKMNKRRCTTNYCKVKLIPRKIIQNIEHENSNTLPIQTLVYFRNQLIDCKQILTNDIIDFEFNNDNNNLCQLVNSRNFIDQITDSVIEKM